MAVKFLSAGLSETFDTSLFDLSSLSNGTAAASSSNVHNQQRSFLSTMNSGGFNRKAILGAAGTFADAGGRLTFYFFFDHLPDSSTDADNNKSNAIAVWLTTGSATNFAIGLNSTGKLRIYDKNYVPQATSSTTLAINTLYRISFAYTNTSASVNECRMWINGVLEASTTNISTVVAVDRFFVGGSKWDSTTNAANLYYTDIYADDSTSLADPGDIRVTAKRPNANGTTNGFTTQIGSGGSGYGSGHSPQVNERALSQTNGWSMVGAGAQIVEEYNIESAATGDTDVSTNVIRGVIGWVRAKTVVDETASMMLDGTFSSIALTNTATTYRAVSPHPTTYPLGTGTDIGIRTTVTLTTVSLYECGILIASIAPIVSTPGVLALTTTKFVPVIALPKLVTPGKLSLTTTKFAPNVIKGLVIVPGVKALVTIKFAPNILLPKLATPAKIALILTKYPPQIDAPNPQHITVGTKNLILTGYAPVASESHDQRIVPGTAHLILTRYRPQILLPFPIGGNTSLLVINEDYLANLQTYSELNWGNFWLIDDYVPLVMLDQD